MSVKIVVSNSRSEAVKNADVKVWWKPSGLSSAKTDDKGVADLKCNGGTLKEITVWGETIWSTEHKVGDNEMFSVTYR